MKNLIILIGLILSINCFGQAGKTVQLMGEVTINGNESALLKSGRMSQTNGFIGIDVVWDTTAITAGTGYIIAKASLFDYDSAFQWKTLTTVDYSVYTGINDTMTVSSKGSNMWGISGLPFDYVGVYIKGAVGDTFTVKAYYVGKEY